MKRIFFGTETPHILNSTVYWSREHSWELYYTSIFDRATVSSSEVGIGFNDLEYISMLLNLDLSLQCPFTICTSKSNWCSLLQELRATISRKADLIDIDLQTNDNYYHVN